MSAPKKHTLTAGQLAAVEAALDQADTLVGVLDELGGWLDGQPGVALPWGLAGRLHNLLAESYGLSRRLTQLPDPLAPVPRVGGPEPAAAPLAAGPDGPDGDRSADLGWLRSVGFEDEPSDDYGSGSLQRRGGDDGYRVIVRHPGAPGGWVLEDDGGTCVELPGRPTRAAVRSLCRAVGLPLVDGGGQ